MPLKTNDNNNDDDDDDDNNVNNSKIIKSNDSNANETIPFSRY